MLRKLREKQADMTAAAIDVPRMVLFEHLRKEGYGPADAAIIMFACHPFEVKQPIDRRFEDQMRELCLDFVLTSRDMDHSDRVAYARKRIVRYFAMASFVADRSYVERFKEILADHVERSEAIPKTTTNQEEATPAPKRSRRTEPLRAHRSRA